ncbi:MAG: sodium-dependent bicarbonate transport family permease [Rhodocyclaceae bacterium]|nr:sodium-dependent bicarbonate transport family permease [Rhodocyclaceae bacterium]
MQNFLDPAILFFVFGVFAGFARSNLEIPQPISRFLSLYLLMALGLKGGFALNKSGLTPEVAISLGTAILLAVVIPLIGYNLLRRVLGGFDAAAIAATYGSVSAVTFITATQYLETHQYPFGAHMAAAMALMESPAIIMAVIFANMLRRERGAAGGAAAHEQHTPLGKILHESFTDGAQLLLLGAMLVGIITGDAGKAVMAPFSVDLFKGMLSFFLLDMGLTAARNMHELRGKSPWVVGYGLLGPVAHASLALGLCMLFGIGPGDGALLMVLAASASYIAVPAVLRFAIPEANPSLYFGLSLGLTFPLNILFGIPIYVGVAHAVLG